MDSNVIERLIILCDNSITDNDVVNFAHPLGKYVGKLSLLTDGNMKSWAF